MLLHVGFFEVARAVGVHANWDRCTWLNSKKCSRNCADSEIISDFALILNMAAFRGKITPSIVGAWAGDRAQLTCSNGLVLVIIVFNVGEAHCAPFGL